MINERRVILTTFAGRRDRMNLFLVYARAAVAAGIIDELHVWDFARKPEDKLWLETEFPYVRRLPDKLEYRKIDQFLVDEQCKTSFEIRFRCSNDFHLRIFSDAPGQPGYEIVLGGWSNTRSVIREVKSQSDIYPEGYELTSAKTLGLASDQVFKSVTLEISKESLSVFVDQQKLLQTEIKFAPGLATLFACSGFGTGVDLSTPRRAEEREALFVAKMGDYPPFTEFYNYYASRFHEYKDSIFLKADDDIIFCDLKRLADFIKFRIDHENYFIVSANVVNNGVCAFYQQQTGLIPETLMSLELPPGGLCGKLWESADLASALHDFFLNDPARFTGHYEQESWVEWDQRISINFIAWLGHDLVELACHHADDEQSISCDIPARLGRTNAIYEPFIVGHLSFYSQDKGIDVEDLMTRYARLCPTVL